jgi:transposase InsO family protein
LIGTIRREFLDFVPFWNAHDLRGKLNECEEYYNRDRVHQALGGDPPDAGTETAGRGFAWLNKYT